MSALQKISAIIEVARTQQDYIESAIIVAVGVYNHIFRMHIINLRHAELPLFAANFASTIFIFSILCLMGKLRLSLRIPELTGSQKVIKFIVEMSIILFLTDVLMRNVWVTGLKIINYFCICLAEYLMESNTTLVNQTTRLTSWLRHDAFYYGRFFFSLIIFYLMIYETGFQAYIIRMFKQKTEEKPDLDELHGITDHNAIRCNCNYDADVQTDDEEENIKPVTHRSRSRYRRTYPEPKHSDLSTNSFFLHETDEECYC